MRNSADHIFSGKLKAKDLAWTVKCWHACSHEHPISMAHDSENICCDLCVISEEPVPIATLNEEDKLRILFFQLNDLKVI